MATEVKVGTCVLSWCSVDWPNLPNLGPGPVELKSFINCGHRGGGGIVCNGEFGSFGFLGP